MLQGRVARVGGNHRFFNRLHCQPRHKVVGRAGRGRVPVQAQGRVAGLSTARMGAEFSTTMTELNSQPPDTTRWAVPTSLIRWPGSAGACRGR